LYGTHPRRYPARMCRNIKTLYNVEPEATEDEVRASAVQFVRKISGYTKPSQANEAAFARAVDDVTAVALRLLDELVTTAPPRDREAMAERARARHEHRLARQTA
jgi:hypothetical protein